MIIKLVEVISDKGGTYLSQRYKLKEIFINPEHIVALREDNDMRTNMNEGVLPEGINPQMGFTRLYLDRGQHGLDVTVVGDPTSVREKLNFPGKHGILHD